MGNEVGIDNMEMHKGCIFTNKGLVSLRTGQIAQELTIPNSWWHNSSEVYAINSVDHLVRVGSDASTWTLVTATATRTWLRHRLRLL